MDKRETHININTQGGDMAGGDIIKTTVVQQQAVGNGIAQGAGASVVINNGLPNRGVQGNIHGAVHVEGNGFIGQAIGVNSEVISYTHTESGDVPAGLGNSLIAIIREFVEEEYDGEWPTSLKRLVRYIGDHHA